MRSIVRREAGRSWALTAGLAATAVGCTDAEGAGSEPSGGFVEPGGTDESGTDEGASDDEDADARGDDSGPCGLTAWYGDASTRLDLTRFDLLPTGGWVIVGNIEGALDGGAALGEKDAVVIVSAPDGTTQWVDQLGTAEVDFATDVAVAGGGEIVVTGATLGELTEGTRFGAHDGFVRRYDALGSLVWSTPFGTGQHDVPRALALAPDGSTVVVGTTGPRVPFGYEDEADAFVAIFDEAGSQASWTTFGSRVLDAANDVVVSPSGEIYVVGLTMGVDISSLGSPMNVTGGSLMLPTSSAFLAKFAPDGATEWADQVSGVLPFGDDKRDADANGVAVAIDSEGEVIVAGVVSGDLNGVKNPSDASEKGLFVCRYDATGALLQTAIPLPRTPFILDLDLTDEGDILLTGSTSGAFALGEIETESAGNFDAWVAILAPDATPVEVAQFGSSGVDYGHAAEIDTTGRVLVLGSASGAIDDSERPPGATHFVKRFCAGD